MRYIVQALVYSFYDYCFSSLALLVALQNTLRPRIKRHRSQLVIATLALDGFRVGSFVWPTVWRFRRQLQPLLVCSIFITDIIAQLSHGSCLSWPVRHKCDFVPCSSCLSQADTGTAHSAHRSLCSGLSWILLKFGQAFIPLSLPFTFALTSSGLLAIARHRPT